MAAQVASSSISRLSHNAWVTWALSTILLNSPARNSGMVLTGTAPTFMAAIQHATNAGLFPERIRIRLPGITP